MPKFKVRIHYDQWEEYEVEANSAAEVNNQWETDARDEDGYVARSNWRPIAAIEYEDPTIRKITPKEDAC